MPIRFECPVCNARYSINPAGAGKVVECKRCGQWITVPAAGQGARTNAPDLPGRPRRQEAPRDEPPNSEPASTHAGAHPEPVTLPDQPSAGYENSPDRPPPGSGGLIALAAAGVLLVACVGATIVVVTISRMSLVAVRAYQAGLPKPTPIQLGYGLIWLSVAGALLLALLAGVVYTRRGRGPNVRLALFASVSTLVLLIGGLVGLEVGV